MDTDKLMILIESVEANMYTELLESTGTAEEKVKRFNISKEAILNAMKNLIDKLIEKLTDLTNMINNKFKEYKSTEMAVDEDTTVLDVKIDSILIDKKYDPNEFTFEKTYKAGDKVNQGKILKEMASFKKALRTVNKDITRLSGTGMDPLNEIDRNKKIVSILNKAISTHTQLVANLKVRVSKLEKTKGDK